LRNQVFKIIESAVTEMNEELDYDSLREVNDDTPLFGGEDGVDSLSLVSIIISIESGIFNELDKSVTLADEKAMSMHNSPYRTVGTLLNFAMQRLEEA
jgi:acyl carrier protein